jgi:hypothetical protein
MIGLSRATATATATTIHRAPVAVTALYIPLAGTLLNHRPIFLNTFSKGGSNLLWNLFQSHPEVVSPLGETHQAFRDPWARFVTAFWTRQLDFWSLHNLSPRHRAPMPFLVFMDRRLYHQKLKNLGHPDNGERAPGSAYTMDELAQARLVSKNHNGQAFLTEVLLRAYPDATFIAMVRDGFALGEAYLRRGPSRSAEEFGHVYNAVAGQMIADSETLPNYHLVRFEDLFSAQLPHVLEQLYGQAGLDYATLGGMLRLKAKELPPEDAGTLEVHWRANAAEEPIVQGKKYWLPIDQVERFIDFDINRFHHERLAKSDRDTLVSVSGGVLRKLGYL